AVLAAPGMAGAQAKPERIKITLATGATTGGLSAFTVVEKGFLKQQNIDATVITTLAGTAIPAAVLSDAVQVGAVSVPTVALLRAQGAKVKIVAPTSSAPNFVVVVPKGSSIPITGRGEATWQDTI